MYSQKDMKEDCMEERENRSYGEQETTIESIEGQVCPIKW